MSDVWVDEALYSGWGQRFRVRTELARYRSAFQDIHIFESWSHGRVMLLDGAVQITEADEFIYQEMISHVPLIAHGDPRRVLIIGAGDGGVLRRVLQHACVERVTMVEIDGDVIRLAREHLPDIGGLAWDDCRASVVVGDGIAHVAAADPESYDVIIVDSTDPAGPGESLFSESFYADCRRVLGPRGIIVNQNGVPFMQPDELRDAGVLRARHFRHVSAYVVAVPTYVGGFMALGIASDCPVMVDAATARDRADARGLSGRTRYWNPELHAASFVLPTCVAELLPRTYDISRLA